MLKIKVVCKKLMQYYAEELLGQKGITFIINVGSFVIDDLQLPHFIVRLTFIAPIHEQFAYI